MLKIFVDHHNKIKQGYKGIEKRHHHSLVEAISFVSPVTQYHL